jgi:hypothetical protein
MKCSYSINRYANHSPTSYITTLKILMQYQMIWNKLMVCLFEIRIFHGGDGEEYCLLRRDSVLPGRNLETFRSNVLSLSSGSKSKQINQQESSSKQFCLLGLLLDAEDGKSRFLRNVVKFLQDYKISHASIGTYTRRPCVCYAVDFRKENQN